MRAVGYANPRKARPLAMLLSALVLFGCSDKSDQPSLSAVKPFLEKWLNSHSSTKIIEIDHVEKIDGLAAELVGVKIYEAKVGYIIRYPLGLPLGGTATGCSGKKRWEGRIPANDSDKCAMMIAFRKTDNGWQIDTSGVLGKIQPFNSVEAVQAMKWPLSY